MRMDHLRHTRNLMLGSPTMTTNSRTFGVEPPASRKIRARRALPPPLTLALDAQTFFNAVLDGMPDKTGVMLTFEQSTQNLSMVYKFSFIDDQRAIEPLDERVDLGRADGRALWVHKAALLKVLGATVRMSAQRADRGPLPTAKSQKKKRRGSVGGRRGAREQRRGPLLWQKMCSGLGAGGVRALVLVLLFAYCIRAYPAMCPVLVGYTRVRTRSGKHTLHAPPGLPCPRCTLVLV